MMKNLNLSSRVAVVTGSGRGIGRVVALKLAQRGAAVVINDIGDGAGARESAAEIKAQGGESLVTLADVSVSAAVDELVRATVSKYGRIDILVNNAGITRDSLLMRMSEDNWDRVLATNLKSAFLCTRAVLKYMLRQRYGRVINISSIAGLAGNAGQANYASAKAGLIALTKTTAREVASRGITANAVAPGFIDTDMTRQLSDKVRQNILGQIPLGRAGSPEDVAQAVLFFASEEAGYITGQVLNVDGGTLMV